MDFVDEDIRFVTPDQTAACIARAAQTAGAMAAQLSSRAPGSAELRVAVVGRPNVGKSSLVNALAGRRVAIVADQTGTTRDYVEVSVDLRPSGEDNAPALPARAARFRCTVVDTAGVEPTPPGVVAALNAAAQRLAAEQSARADCCIVCLDSTLPFDEWAPSRLVGEPDRTIVVLTKCDQTPRFAIPPDVIATSAQTGQGLGELRARLAACLAGRRSTSAGAVAATVSRCHDGLRRTVESLTQAWALVTAGGGDELVAAEIRLSLDELGRIVGAVYTDDLLDRIFSRFCIGK